MAVEPKGAYLWNGFPNMDMITDMGNMNMITDMGSSEMGGYGR